MTRIGGQQNTRRDSLGIGSLKNLEAQKLPILAHISGKEQDIDMIRRVPYIVSKVHKLWSING